MAQELDDHIALRATQLRPYVSDDLEAGRHILQHLRNIFAQLAQLTAALGACNFIGQMRVDFARQMLRQRTPRRLVLRRSIRCCCRSVFGLACLQFFELEFQLLDLARDLLASRAEHHAAQLSDDQLQMFDLAITVEQLLLLRTQFTLLRYDQSFERRSIQCGQISNNSASLGHDTEYDIDM
jgi:hypothetical protein